MNPSPARDNRQPSAAVVRQAIEWMLRLNNQAASARVIQRCEQWRGAHPDHECAWQRVLSLNVDLKHRFQALPSGGVAFEALENSAQRMGRRQAMKLLTGLLVAGSSAWVARDVTEVDLHDLLQPSTCPPTSPCRGASASASDGARVCLPEAVSVAN